MMKKKINLTPVRVKTITLATKPNNAVRVNDGGYTWVG